MRTHENSYSKFLYYVILFEMAKSPLVIPGLMPGMDEKASELHMKRISDMDATFSRMGGSNG